VNLWDVREENSRARPGVGTARGPAGKKPFDIKKSRAAYKEERAFSGLTSPNESKRKWRVQSSTLSPSRRILTERKTKEEVTISHGGKDFIRQKKEEKGSPANASYLEDIAIERERAERS